MLKMSVVRNNRNTQGNNNRPLKRLRKPVRVVKINVEENDREIPKQQEQLRNQHRRNSV
jgi:hypothetical protein